MSKHILNPESKFYEYKLILNDRFERSIVALLNSSTGGTIYIGVNDDGEIIGVEKPDEVQLQIADRIKNNIAPETLGLYDVILEQTYDKNPLYYIKVIVSSGTEKPYYLKQKGMTPDGCFIRIGSQTQSLSVQMIENLFARRTRCNLRVIEAPRQDLTFNQLRNLQRHLNFIRLTENTTFLLICWLMKMVFLSNLRNMQEQIKWT